jgi:hypothetical protein
VFLWLGDKGRPTKVIHDKARITGRTVDDFMLEVADVVLPVESVPEAAVQATRGDGIASETGSMRIGLRVQCVEPQPIDERPLDVRLLEMVQLQPGIGLRRLRERAGARFALVREALDLLLEERRLRIEPGPGRIKLHFPA